VERGNHIEEFNVTGQCDICKQNNMCTEIITITKDRKQKVEFWCKDCIDKINEEEAKEQELQMQEVYEGIIRDMH
jgi:hypothetical protein